MIRKKRTLGHAFPDQVGKVSGRVNQPKQVQENDWKDQLLPNFDSSYGVRFIKSPWAVMPFSVICLILFFIIFVRLFHLQIVEGNTNRKLADGNRIQIKIYLFPI